MPSPSRIILGCLTFLVFASNCGNSCECSRTDDDQICAGDPAVLIKKQHFNITIAWVRYNSSNQNFNKGIGGDELKEMVRRRLEKCVVGADTRMNITVDYRHVFDLENIEAFSTKVNVETITKPESTPNQLLDRDLLATLNNMVDCDKKCIAVYPAGLLYDLIPSSYLSVLNQESPITAVGKMRLSLAVPELNENYKCDLCNQIKASESDTMSSLKVYYNIFRGIIASIANLLDPHKWLGIIVGVWLTTCFIIAVVIQRRDRRRLRLYLEERTDYSFSARRQIAQ